MMGSGSDAFQGGGHVVEDFQNSMQVADGERLSHIGLHGGEDQALSAPAELPGEADEHAHPQAGHEAYAGHIEDERRRRRRGPRCVDRGANLVDFVLAKFAGQYMDYDGLGQLLYGCDLCFRNGKRPFIWRCGSAK